MSEGTRAARRRAANAEEPQRRSTAQSGDTPGPRRASSGQVPVTTGDTPLRDRFESVPKLKRVGVHRTAQRTGSRLVRTLWILLSAAVITAIGIIFVVIGPGNLLFPSVGGGAATESGPSTERIVGTVAPDTTVTVLNASGDEAVGTGVQEAIRENGWGIVTFADDISDESITISAVFYVDPADEALAKGLGEELGGVYYYQGDQYQIYESQLVVLLAPDYHGPGAQ